MLLRLFKTLLIVYAIFLAAISIRRYFNFTSEVIDLGFYHSVLIQLSQFQIPRIWEQTIFVWADHFEPILFLLAPIYWFVKDAGVIFSLQTILVLTASIPLYLLAKLKTKNEEVSLSLVLAYLAFDGIQFGYAYGFHPIMLFPFFFFWMAYFLEKKCSKFFWVFFILTLMVKEEASLILIFYSLYLIIFRKINKTGLIMLIISGIWGFICFKIIFPYFSYGAGFRHLGQYAGFWQRGFLELITPISKIGTMLHTFGAFFFLPFFYPPSLLIIIPSFLEKFLSNNIAGLNGFHYSAAITASILIAGLEVVNIFKKHFKLLAILIIFMAIFQNISYGYTPLSPINFNPRIFIQTSHEKLLNQVISEIPKEASISTQYVLAPRFNRPYDRLHTTGNLPEYSDYIILDDKSIQVLTTLERDRLYFESIKSNPRYILIREIDGIKVFRKS